MGIEVGQVEHRAGAAGPGRKVGQRLQERAAQVGQAALVAGRR